MVQVLYVCRRRPISFMYMGILLSRISAPTYLTLEKLKILSLSLRGSELHIAFVNGILMEETLKEKLFYQYTLSRPVKILD